MLHKAVSVFLLLIILGGFIPVASATELAEGDRCTHDNFCPLDTICMPRDECPWRANCCVQGCRTDDHIAVHGGGSRCSPNQVCRDEDNDDNIFTGICINEDTGVIAPTPAESDDPCEGAQTSLIQGMGNFITGNLMWGAGFFAKDALVSFLQEKKIFGWAFGGIFEPIDQTLDFLRDAWLTALTWGIIASVFNLLAGILIDGMINLNLTLSAGNPLVAYGGGIILQIVNLGFIISIIVIGIATILRLKKDEYSADKLLFKLIIGVIFANLTIPMMATIATLGTNITESMYRASSPCAVNITGQFTAWRLSDIFMMTLFRESPEEQDLEREVGNIIDREADAEIRTGTGFERQAGRARGILGVVLNVVTAPIRHLLALIAGSAVSSIAALTFLTFAFFLLIRFVILMLLITFSPLIWLGFIFKDFTIPGFGNIWKAWWSQFLKWTFFGPMLVLFLAFTSAYLSAVTHGTGNPVIDVSMLLAVILISAMGLFMAYKFSGAAGNLVTAAATGGIGFVAGKVQQGSKLLQRKSELASENAKDKGQHYRARLLGKTAKVFEAGKGVPLGMGQLKHVGIKPNVKALDDEKWRQKHTRQALSNFSKSKDAKLPDRLNDLKRLNLSEEDIKNLSKDEKETVTQAVRTARASGMITDPKQLLTLKKLEKSLAPEIATATIKEIPTGMVSLTDAQKALQLAVESTANILQEGIEENIEKMIESIKTLEAAPAGTLDPTQTARLQKLRREFNDKIAEDILDKLDPATNHESILNLDMANLNQISKTGTTTEKQKIIDSLAELNRSTMTMTAEQIAAWIKVDAKVTALKMKNEWL